MKNDIDLLDKNLNTWTMKKNLYFILSIISIFLFTQCDNKNATKTHKSSGSFSDGTYNAEVDYYNPKTGTSSIYNLEVEIKNNLLIMIYWHNGGWLDDSHFTPTDISSGETSFISDKGYYYTVTILSESTPYNRTRSYIYEEEDDYYYDDDDDYYYYDNDDE